MTQIYLIRHCEALGNVKRVFQGTSDFDISEMGVKQLEYLSKRFKYTDIDKVYASPLIRAMKTAEAVAGPKGLPVIPEMGLIELDGGILEGKPFRESFDSIEGLADTWDNHPEDFAPSGGEAMRDAYLRIWKTVLRLAEENKGKAVAAATHGGVIRCLLCRLIYNDIKHLKDVPWSENTSVSLIEFDNNLNPTVKFFNNYSHVPEKYIPKRSRLSTAFEVKK